MDDRGAITLTERENEIIEYLKKSHEIVYSSGNEQVGNLAGRVISSLWFVSEAIGPLSFSSMDQRAGW
jgi:hypothetical protein